MSSSSPLPLVSVGIPTFNRADALARAVESVQRQDYPHLEILISDNASPDHTPQVCRQLAESDSRIHYFRQEKNRGPLPNFAFLLKQSVGTFFIWVGDDDTLEPDVLSRYVRFLDQHQDYVLVGGTVRYWDQGSIFMEEKGFTFPQEHPAKRISSFYKKVKAGGIFHGLMRRKIAADIRLKNVIGSDWCFTSAMLMAGKCKQLEFAGYNKSLIGLSLDFEQYAAAVGASRFGQCNPNLALAWHASVQLLADKQIYQSLSRVRRVSLFLLIASSLLWRLHAHNFVTDPRKFAWMTTRSVVRTLVPEKLIQCLRGDPKSLAEAEATESSKSGRPSKIGQKIFR